MIVNVNGVKYEFKTSFNEFTIDEYLTLLESVNEPLIKRVSIYTGIPVDALSKLALENFIAICEQVKFIEQEELLSAMCEAYNGKDVGLESYGKMEKAKGLISGSSILKALPKISELYSEKETAGKPLLEVWGVCVFYLNSISAFFDKFKRLGLHEYSEEELEADVELLEVYKHYPTVFKIGAERGMTNDEVLSLPAIEIYMQMMYEFDKAEYEKRYNQVVQQRNEHRAKLV